MTKCNKCEYEELAAVKVVDDNGDEIDESGLQGDQGENDSGLKSDVKRNPLQNLDDSSKKIGDLLLKGWTMLNIHCEGNF
jgi:hypothetical protein